MNTIKTTLAAAMFAALGTQALAVATDAGEDEFNSIEFCIVMGTIAETVMEYRQEGGSMSNMMQVMSNMDSDPALTELSMQIVRDAFEIPRFSSPEYQRREIVDFRNEVEAVCFASF